ncbi:hypothetical protein LCGC14_0789850 [marine sediment metagenome]|uniref:Uncharacterized protein n=1 Tax=marine sediment metagenome TaxID=412755 RepID=A0A0F9PSZ6_9ZZZZ
MKLLRFYNKLKSEEYVVIYDDETDPYVSHAAPGFALTDVVELPNLTQLQNFPLDRPLYV